MVVSPVASRTLPFKCQSRLQQTTFICFHCFSEKIRLDVPSESSARQRIHMKNQALFSSKDKSKKLKCRLLQILFGTLRVKILVLLLWRRWHELLSCLLVSHFFHDNA